MTQPISIDPLALADLRQASRWYDERCPGLGQVFLAKFELTVAQIRQFPEGCERIDEHLRRISLGRFPYFVAYRVLPEAIQILGVMHERRDPSRLAVRLMSSSDE